MNHRAVVELWAVKEKAVALSVEGRLHLGFGSSSRGWE